MKKREVDLPTSDIRTVCKVIKIYQAPLLYEGEGGTAVITLNPLGTDFFIPVECDAFKDYMKYAEGRFVNVDLSASWSFLKSTSQRNYKVTDSSGGPFKKNTPLGFKVVGQYVGDTGVDFLIKSEFLVLVTHDGECDPKIGDWVEASGELGVSWAPHDVVIDP